LLTHVPIYVIWNDVITAYYANVSDLYHNLEIVLQGLVMRVCSILTTVHLRSNSLWLSSNFCKIFLNSKNFDI